MDLLSQIRSECANLSVNKDYLGRYPLAETKSLFVPTRYGSLLVHLYRPHTKKDLLPTIVNFHGGAFIKGYRGQDIEFSHMMAYRSVLYILMSTIRPRRNTLSLIRLKKGLISYPM